MDFLSDLSRGRSVPFTFLVSSDTNPNLILREYTAGEYSSGTVPVGEGSRKYTKDGKEFTLECTWEDGKMNGEGNMLDSDMILVMKLHFVNDVIEGEGSLYDNGQLVFKGTWKDGQRCGFCQEYCGGRVVYKGEYSGDVRHGFGIEYDEKGDIGFEGEWVNGNRGLKSIEEDDYGKRILVERDGDNEIIYKGGFKEGTLLRDGCGTEYQGGVPVRVCEYQEGNEERVIKEFKGTTMIQYDNNGKRIYEGEFSDSGSRGPYAHGKGRQYVNNVLVYNGEFDHGVRCGHGCSYYPSRTLQYDGDWMANMAHGHGKFNNEEGILVVEGEFEEDVCLDGDRLIHRDTGVIESASRKGCFCFGSSRRAGKKQLTSSHEEKAVEITSKKDLDAAPDLTVALCFKAGGCAEPTMLEIDLSRFRSLRRLTIEANALPYLKTLVLSELPQLRYLDLGKDALVNSMLGGRYDNKQYTIEGAHRTLRVDSCRQLQEITLEAGACADFVKLQLADLPALKKLRIGVATDQSDSPSNCFYWANSLSLEGM